MYVALFNDDPAYFLYNSDLYYIKDERPKVAWLLLSEIQDLIIFESNISLWNACCLPFMTSFHKIHTEDHQ